MATTLRVHHLILIIAAISVRNTSCRIPTQSAPEEDTSVAVKCEKFCHHRKCECGKTDWFWTFNSDPKKFIGKQIWARMKGQQYQLNSVCGGHAPRNVEMTINDRFDLEIKGANRLANRVTVCCYTGEIMFGTPLMFCSSPVKKSGSLSVWTTTLTVIVPVIVLGVAAALYALSLWISK